jgi:hypothetical protein
MVTMRIWRFLDLITTLAVALTVGVLGMLNLVSTPVLAGATLTTLGVVAMGTLTARLQMQSLAGTSAELAELTRHHLTDSPSIDRVLTVSASAAGVDLSDAGDIGIIGVTLNCTLRSNLLAFQKCLRRGGTLRVAVIDPSGEVTAEAARRSAMPGAGKVFVRRLRPTLDLLAVLAETAGPGRVEVRLLDFVPAYGLLMVDGRQPYGRIHVDIYPHTLGGPEPALNLHAGHDPAWFPHFAAEFDEIWSAGRSASPSRSPQISPETERSHDCADTRRRIAAA